MLLHFDQKKCILKLFIKILILNDKILHFLQETKVGQAWCLMPVIPAL